MANSKLVSTPIPHHFKFCAIKDELPKDEETYMKVFPTQMQ